ncbi:MAG TPA: hypothetical protein VEV83_06790 [Parafilimonas sp.]|nr:hypothetical protein [Parafilimonas sp.]
MHALKRLGLSLAPALLLHCSNAQTNQWTVKTGESIQEVLGDSTIYRYPQFVDGRVYYDDGKVSRGLLNFDRLTGQMEFIAPSRDTLAIANEATVKYIAVQNDTFYFDKVYLELIHHNAGTRIGKMDVIKLLDIKKEGAFGQMNSTSSITSTSSFYNGRQDYQLTQKGEITLKEQTKYFISHGNDDFLPATKKNINKIFSQKMSAIEPFMKEKNIDISKQEDLVRLIDFLEKP